MLRYRPSLSLVYLHIISFHFDSLHKHIVEINFVLSINELKQIDMNLYGTSHCQVDSMGAISMGVISTGVIYMGVISMGLISMG